MLIFSDQIWWNYICYGYYQQKWQISTKLTNTIAKNITKIIILKKQTWLLLIITIICYYYPKHMSKQKDIDAVTI